MASTTRPDDPLSRLRLWIRRDAQEVVFSMAQIRTVLYLYAEVPSMSMYCESLMLTAGICVEFSTPRKTQRDYE